MKINKPTSTITFLMTSLILMIIFLVPTYQKSNLLEEDLIQKQAEYDGQPTYYSGLIKTVSNVESKQDSLGKINSALPPNYSIAPIIYFLHSIAAENSLDIKSIIFSGPFIKNYGQAQGSNVKDVNFTIDLSGSYQGIKKFLVSVDKSSRLFEVNTISFALLKPQDSSGSLEELKTHNFKLEIKTHTY